MTASDAIAVSTPPAGIIAEHAPVPVCERFVLTRRRDRLHAAIGGAEAVPARLVLMRPISEPDGGLALLGDDQRCLAEFGALTELAEASRAIASEELHRRYCVPEILGVLSAVIEQGNRYLCVRTDRGTTQLLFREPDRALTWVTQDHVLLRDVHGNRYRISALSRLDAPSREAFLNAL